MNPEIPPSLPVAETADPPFWSWWDVLLFLGPIGLLFIAPVFLMPAGAKPVPTMAGLVVEYVIFGIWFLALTLYFRLRYDKPLMRSLGWIFPWRWMKGSLLLGPAVAVGLGSLGALLQAEPLDPLRQIVTGPGTAAIAGVFAVLGGPLVEELIFRGFLLPLLVRTCGAALAITLSALPFALLHGPQYEWSWQHLLLLLAASCVFGWVRVGTGSTAASAAVHAGYNLMFYISYLIQRKDLYS